MSNLSTALRYIADAIDDGQLASKMLLIGLTEDGDILSEDSDLTCREAAELCQQFTANMKVQHDRYYGRFYPRAKRGARCTGAAR